MNRTHHFSIPEDITYLNCAYMSPMPTRVENAGLEGFLRKSKPWEFTPADFFEPIKTAQAKFAEIIHADQPNRVALIPSASYGFGNICHNVHISKGQKIVAIEEQFPSNIYSWQRLADENQATLERISAPDGLTGNARTSAWNEKLLNSIDADTVAVTLPLVHWADGTLFDLDAVRKRTLEVGALMTVDGTQSVGAYPFDINRFQPDALVCASYKWLLGPYSFGFAWFGPRFDEGKPIEENWIHRKNSEQFDKLVAYQSEYREGAARYAVGELSNFALLPAAIAGLETVLEIGVDQISSHTAEITRAPIEQLRELGCLVNQDVPHLFGIRPGSDFNIQKIKSALSAEKIFVSYRGDAIRISPHIYNSQSDMEKLVDVLASVNQTVS